MMRPTTHTHKFHPEELEELKEKTGLDDSEEAMKRWARHNYPIRTASYYAIGQVKTNEEGGSIEIIER